ncbi:maestro heat-like repeat family member 5 [Cynocephalus volans]|uniref:maestro heat-like repeat family member 5 n=1 Tax=Cynocephalus volans TaxID=110931 RepID=UPI002FC5A689
MAAPHSGFHLPLRRSNSLSCREERELELDYPDVGLLGVCWGGRPPWEERLVGRIRAMLTMQQSMVLEAICHCLDEHDQAFVVPEAPGTLLEGARRCDGVRAYPAAAHKHRSRRKHRQPEAWVLAHLCAHSGWGGQGLEICALSIALCPQPTRREQELNIEDTNIQKILAFLNLDPQTTLDKTFLFHLYGLILRECTHKELVRRHLACLLELSHQTAGQRQGMALAVGVAATAHLEVVWTVLERLGHTRFLRLALPSPDNQLLEPNLHWKWVSSTCLLCYGQMALQARERILPWVDSIVARMVYYFSCSSQTPGRSSSPTTHGLATLAVGGGRTGLDQPRAVRPGKGGGCPPRTALGLRQQDLRERFADLAPAPTCARQDDILDTSFLSAAVMLTKALGREDGAQNYKFTQIPELIGCLLCLLQKEPNVLATLRRQKIILVIEGLSNLRPHFTPMVKSRILQTCLRSLYTLPPMETLKSSLPPVEPALDVMELYRKTAHALGLLLQSFVSENESLDEVCFLLQHTEHWLRSDKSHECQRAVQSISQLLQYVVDFLHITEEATPSMLGHQIGLLTLLWQDKDGVTRDLSRRCVFLLLQLLAQQKGELGTGEQGAEPGPGSSAPGSPASLLACELGQYCRRSVSPPQAKVAPPDREASARGGQGWRPGGRPAEPPAQRTAAEGGPGRLRREQLGSPQKPTAAASPSLPRTWARARSGPLAFDKNLTVAQQTQLVLTLQHSLCSHSQPRRDLASQLLLMIFEGPGLKTEQVAEVLHSLFRELPGITFSNMQAMMKAMTALGTQHTQETVEVVLSLCPPSERRILPLWKALASNNRLARKVITLLYMKLKLRPPGDLIRSMQHTQLTSLLALGTIYELLYTQECKPAVHWAFAGILLGLLTQLHYLFELGMVEGISDYQEDVLEMKPLSPFRTCLEALKGLFWTTNYWEVFAYLKLLQGWELFEHLETYTEGVTLLARAMAYYDCEVKAVLGQAVISMKSSEERDNVVAILVITEFLNSPVVSQHVSRRRMDKFLSLGLHNPNQLVRAMSLTGLSSALMHPEKGALLRDQLTGLLESFLKPEPKDPSGLMEILGDILHRLGVQRAGVISLKIAQHLPPLFEDEREEVRGGAIFLFGHVIHGGGKRFQQALKTIASQVLVPLLFHLVDPCPGVVKKTKFTFLRCAILLRWEFRKELFSKLAWGHGLGAENDVFVYMVESNFGSYHQFLMQALVYLQSPHQSLKLAAMKFIGEMLQDYFTDLCFYLKKGDVRILRKHFEILKQDQDRRCRRFYLSFSEDITELSHFVT